MSLAPTTNAPTIYVMSPAPLSSDSPTYNYIVNNQTTNGTKIEFWEEIVFASCGFFALAATLMAIFLIYRHLKHWTEPKPQTRIVRILIMIPIYSIDSWLSVYFHQYSIYFDIARDAYEAYVLFQFFELLVYYFESECKRYFGEDFADVSVGELLANFPPHRHPFPFYWCFSPVIPGPYYFLKSKRYILQYVIVKPLMTIIAVILHIFGLYRPGSFSPKYGYLWISIIINFSVSWALYWLLLFYMMIEEVIQDYKPLYKLLAIKAILFFAFWQSVAIGFLSYMEVIPALGNWSQEEVAGGITNVVICVEMFILSIVHIWVFPYDEYRAGTDFFGLLRSFSNNAFISFLICLGTHTLFNTWSNVISRATTDVLNQADLFKEAHQVFSPDNKQKEKLKDKKLTERSKLFADKRTGESYGSPQRKKDKDVELEEFNTPVYF